MATNPKKLQYFLGANSRLGRTSLRTEEGLFVADAINVDVGPSHSLSGRPGCTKVLALEHAHSLWASRDGRAFVVHEGQIHALKLPEGTTTALGIFVPTGMRASFEQLPDGCVVVSTGQSLHRIKPDNTVAPLVYPAPAQLPQAIVTPGDTTWLFCFAYVDASGYVGLCSPQMQAVGNALAFDVPTPPAGLYLQIYASHANGEVPYLVAESAGGRVDVGTQFLGGQCPTQHMQGLMPGEQLCVHGGRLYSVHGPIAYYSEPYQFGVMAPLNFIQLPEPISVFARTPHGCILVADKTYWLAGANPNSADTAGMQVVNDRRALPRSLSYLPDGRPVWVSASGTVIGEPLGTVTELTDPFVEGVDTEGAAGATLPITRAGGKKIISNHHRAGFGRVGVTMTAE